MNTKQMIEGAAVKLGHEIIAAIKDMRDSPHKQHLDIGPLIIKAMTTLFTKHEAAVREREAQWCEDTAQSITR